MDLGLQGKVAIVAAASKGIGRACAWGLAAEGTRVAICARSADELKKTAEAIRTDTGAEVFPLPSDVRNAQEVRTLVERTAEAFGGVDILVTKAGGPPPGPFDIQSTSIKQPIDGLLLSNAIRPGVAGLTRSLVNEVSRDGITINTVCRGRILTDRSRSFLESRAKAAGIPYDEFVQQDMASIPVGRIGEPEEIAHVAVFLASERASYLTGVALPVDGGLVRGLT